MGRMHYVDEGTGESIVMVHGNPTWSFLYRHLIRQLAPKYRCVAMDHIGFGLSDKPTGWTYTPAEHAQNLAQLIEALDLKDITVVVQDWGGPIGLSYALNHPENVKRLVIMNTWMWPVDRDWYYVAFSRFTGGSLGRYLIRRHNFFARVIMPQSYGNRARLTEEIHRHYLKPLEVEAERKGCWVFPEQILGATDWLGALWARREVLAEKPKLIVWGMKDIAFREKELNSWSAAFPDAHVIRLAEVGHYVQEEAVDELGQAVERFVTRGG
jgi:haloalkane dehalogenase